MEKQSNKRTLKNKRILYLEKEIKEIKENSNSHYITKYILNRVMDVIGWIIIAGFVYVWFITRAQTNTIGCEDISVKYV